MHCPMKADLDEDVGIEDLLYPDHQPKRLLRAGPCESSFPVHEFEGKDLRDEELSRSIWISNPGYLCLASGHQASVMQRDFVWDASEIALMKTKGHFTNQFNRKRDKFTEYVEAEARAKKLRNGTT